MEDEVLDLAEHIAHRRNTPPLTRDLMRRFGGRAFIFNVRMWVGPAQDGPTCLHVPVDLDPRGRFETLAGTGVLLRGSAIPLDLRFTSLPLPKLREAAKELGAGKLRDKKSGARSVADRPGAEEWLASRYAQDRFFLFRPEPWSYKDLEELWHAYTHEAREELARR
jgi:hypothetical protein